MHTLSPKHARLAAAICLASSAVAQIDAGPYELGSVAFPASADFNSTILASIGDVDADGAPDFALGDRFAGSVYRQGQVWVYSSASRSILYRLDGNTFDGWLGRTIVALGDVNQDGHDDFAVSSPKAPAVSVISGVDGSTVFTTMSNQTLADFGAALLRLPDLDGDGADELAIGTGRMSSGGLSRNGTVRIHSGATGVLLQELSGEISDQNFGVSLSLIDDLNGDGADDFVVGATFGRPAAASLYDGALYAFDGQTLQPLWRAENLIQEMGWQLTSLGDLDEDGVPDLWTSGLSEMAVVSGRTQQLLLNLNRDRPNQFTDFPDLNGDGVRELVFNAPFATKPGGTGQWHGSLHLLSGADLTTELTPPFFGQAGSRIGTTLASFGEIQGELIYGWSDFGAGVTADRIILAGFRRNLTTSDWRLSIQQGGSVDFHLDFPTELAQSRWQLLASTITPANPIALDGAIPIRSDGLLWDAMLSSSPPPQLSQVRGLLNSQGQASTTLTWTPGDAPRLAGKSLWFTAVAVDASNALLANSVAVRLRFDP